LGGNITGGGYELELRGGSLYLCTDNPDPDYYSPCSQVEWSGTLMPNEYYLSMELNKFVTVNPNCTDEPYCVTSGTINFAASMNLDFAISHTQPPALTRK
jgi:hypothetical protein